LGVDARSVEVYGDSVRLVGRSVGVDFGSIILAAEVWEMMAEVWELIVIV
jgi:hypothetical protein